MIHFMIHLYDTFMEKLHLILQIACCTKHLIILSEIALLKLVFAMIYKFNFISVITY